MPIADSSKVPGDARPPNMQQLATNAIFAEALHRANTTIAPLNTEGGNVPIFWVHSVTGQGTDAIELAKNLGPHQPFYSIRAPSKERNGALAASVEGMARFYVTEIARFQPAGPMIIGGWSAGVVVALEMAQQLQAAGREVRHLVAVDFAPLNSSVKINPMVEFARRATNWLHKQSNSHLSYRLLGGRIWQKMLERTRFAALKTHPLDDLVASLGYSQAEGEFVGTLYDKVEDYVPAPYEGSVLFYSALECSGREAMGNRNLNANRMIRVWQSLAGRRIVSKHASHMIKVWQSLAGRLTVSKIDGDHSSLIKGAAVVALARRMQADLKRPGLALMPPCNTKATLQP